MILLCHLMRVHEECWIPVILTRSFFQPCSDEALERGLEFYDVEIDSEAKPYGHLVDEGNNAKPAEKECIRPEIQVHNGTGRDVQVVSLTHQGHSDLKKKFREIMGKATADVLGETFEDELKQKADQYIAKATEDVVKKATPELQQHAFEEGLRSLPPESKSVKTLPVTRKDGEYYYEVPYPASLQTEADNWEAFVTAYDPESRRYFFTNMLAPCARKFYITGEPHEHFPGFESN